MFAWKVPVGDVGVGLGVRAVTSLQQSVIVAFVFRSHETPTVAVSGEL